MNLQGSGSGSGSTGLLYISFNQDYGCFACGTETGFFICNCDPLKERFRRDFETPGGIGIVEMLFRCNILALVGGGKAPKFPPNKVMIWDDYQNKCIAELEFRSDVKAVKLRRDRIIVVLETKVYVYNFSDLQLLHQVETTPNPKGLCALSPGPNATVLAVPGLKPGIVHVELYDHKQKTTITAHNNPIAQLCLNLDGSRLCTASDKGTLIRIFNTSDGSLLKEFRRGANRAEIYSLAFNAASNALVTCSDKGTVHIYGLDGNTSGSSDPSPADAEDDTKGKNRQSSLAFMGDILPGYFSSEWSFAQFSIPTKNCICAFGPEKNCVVVVCADGTYYKYSYTTTTKNAVEGKQELAASFLRGKDDAMSQ